MNEEMYSKVISWLLLIPVAFCVFALYLMYSPKLNPPDKKRKHKKKHSKEVSLQ